MSNADDVAAIQRALNQAGFGVLRVDGFYGPRTAAAVTAFQRARGLVADGIVGPQTIGALSGLDASAPVVWKHTAHLPDAFFVDGVARFARRGWNFEHLLAVMLWESGVQADKRNSRDPHGAVGLIQFMPENCYWLLYPGRKSVLKESPEAQAAAVRMLGIDAVGQLPYVERFYLPWASAGLTSPGRFYQATLAPATLSKAKAPNDVVCGSRPGDPWPAVYRDNPGFDDLNPAKRKGYIVVADFERLIAAAQAQNAALWAELVARARAAGSGAAAASGGGGGLGVLGTACLLIFVIGGGLAFLWKG